MQVVVAGWNPEWRRGLGSGWEYGFHRPKAWVWMPALPSWLCDSEQELSVSETPPPPRIAMRMTVVTVCTSLGKYLNTVSWNTCWHHRYCHYRHCHLVPFLSPAFPVVGKAPSTFRTKPPPLACLLILRKFLYFNSSFPGGIASDSLTRCYLSLDPKEHSLSFLSRIISKCIRLIFICWIISLISSF